MAAPQDQGNGGPQFEDEISFREADDYVERRRQKEVLDAVQFVSDTQNATESEYERGQIDLETRRAEVRMAVNSLIVETEQLIRHAGATDLLRSRELGSVQLQPPRDLIQFVETADVRVWGDDSLRPKEVYTIHGIQGFLDAPSSFSATWSVKADVESEGPQTVSSTASMRMPVDTSLSVYRQIRGFLGDVDLDLGAQLEDYTADDGPGL